MSKSPEGRRRRGGRAVLHCALLVLVGLAAWHYIDFGEFARAILGASPAVLAVLLLVSTADRFLMAVKWHQLMRAVGLHPPFPRVWSAYYQASIVARLLPISVGADVLRGYVVARGERDRARVVGSIVVEKVVAILGAVALATVGATLLVRELSQAHMLATAALVPAAGVAVLVMFVLSLTDRFGRVVQRLVPGNRPKELVRKLHAAYALFQGRWNPLLVNFALTVVEQALQIVILFFCARAVGVDVSWPVLAAVLALSEFVRKAAIVIEGWGLAEFLVVLTCALAGIDQNRALALSLLSHAVCWVAALPGAWFLIRGRTHRDRTPLASELPANATSHAGPS